MTHLMPINAFRIVANLSLSKLVAQTTACKIPQVIKSGGIERFGDGVILAAATITSAAKVVPETEIILSQEREVGGGEIDVERLVHTLACLVVQDRSKSLVERRGVDKKLRSSGKRRRSNGQCGGRPSLWRNNRRNTLPRKDGIELLVMLEAQICNPWVNTRSLQQGDAIIY